MTQKTIELLIRMWRTTLPTKFKAVYAPTGREWLSLWALSRRRLVTRVRGGYRLTPEGLKLGKWCGCG